MSLVPSRFFGSFGLLPPRVFGCGDRGTRLKVVGYSTSVGKSIAHTRGEVSGKLSLRKPVID